MTYLELLSKGWNIIPGEIHHLERGIELLSTTAFQVPYIVFTSNLTFLHENKQKNVLQPLYKSYFYFCHICPRGICYIIYLTEL